MKGQIEKRGDGVYRIRWYLGRKDGKRCYGSKTIRGTKKQAQRALRDVLARQDRGLAVPSRVPTLSEYVKVWKKGEAAANLRERTLLDYLAVLDRHVLPALGDVPLNAIHTARVESEVVAPLRRRGHTRTARIAVSVLSKVFRSAVKDATLGLVGNPCAGTDRPRHRREKVPPLTAEERAVFLEAIQGDAFADLWLLLLWTGLSPGEALALGWEHLDLVGGTLTVARTLDCKTHKLLEGQAKRDSRLREVPLPQELRSALRERHLREGRPEAGLVFANAKGEPLDLDNLRARHFKPILERAKIERRVTIYTLRHGFGTAGLEAGLDVKDVAVLMGHSSTRTTQDVYQHVRPERRREAAERIVARLGDRS